MVSISDIATSLLFLSGLSLWASTRAIGATDRSRFELPLFIHEHQGTSRDGEPISGGIPFPQGAVFDPHDIHIHGVSGKAVPCQAHQLGICWPDGSLRWALVQFQASVGANKTSTYTLSVNPRERGVMPASRVKVKDLGNEVLVSTGPLEFTVSREAFHLPNTVKVNDRGAFGPQDKVLDNGAHIDLVADHEHMTKEEFDATGRDPKDLAEFGLADTGKIKWNKIERGIDYSDRFAGSVDIQVEENGPLRAVLRIEKSGEKKAGDLGFVARIHAYAGKKFLRIELSVVNYDEFIPVPPRPNPGGTQGYYMAISNTRHVRRYTYTLTPHLGELNAVEVATGAGVRQFAGRAIPVRIRRTRMSGQAVSLLQHSHDAATLQSAANSEEVKGQSPGWIEVAGKGHGIALAGKLFSEVYPKSLAWDAAAKQLRFDLWPGDTPGTGYPLAPGRMRTCEFLLGFDMPGAELSALARSEVRPYPDPDYVAGTGASHRFVSLQDKRFSKYASYVEKTYDVAMKNWLYGDIDYGDQVGWTNDQRWNGYHGVSHEWFLFYLASGDPRYFRAAEANVWHNMDVDTFHWGPFAGLREAEYARKQDHICPSPIQGGIKVWNFGETDYYFLTGKRRVLENLKLNAKALLNCGGVAGNVMVPERATALPFLHLCYMYEAIGDETALAAAYPKAMHSATGYRFRTDTIGPEESKPYLAKLKQINDYMNGVFDRDEHMKCTFLVSYPAEGFHRFYSLTRDESAARGVVKVADFLYNKLIIPTGVTYYAGGAPWEANSPWTPFWDGVEAPAALAYLITRDTKYLDDGKAPVDWILNIRGDAYSSGFAWAGAMGLGGTLPTYLWAMREAGMTQEDLSKMRKDIDYDKALQEIMKVAMSKFDAASINGPDSGPFCRLAAEAGRVMVNLGRYDEAIRWLQKWQGKPYSMYVNWVLDYAREVQAKAAR